MANVFYIPIKSPSDLHSAKTAKSLKKAVQTHKTKDIHLLLAFQTDSPDILVQEFQRMKNRAAFERDLAKTE